MSHLFFSSIAKVPKASKLLCVFGCCPKCDYDADIVISYIAFARMWVVQALPCLGLHLVVTTAWHIAALWRMYLQDTLFLCSMFHVYLEKVKTLGHRFFLFQCFLIFFKI